MSIRLSAFEVESPTVPAWWLAAFGRRQREIRRRIQTWLRLEGEHSTTQVVQRCHGYERTEVEYALASLAGEGVLLHDRRSVPVRHGAEQTQPASFWRLA